MLSWKWLESVRFPVVSWVWKLELRVMLLKLWQYPLTLRKCIYREREWVLGWNLKNEQEFPEIHICYRTLFVIKGRERGVQNVGLGNESCSTKSKENSRGRGMYSTGLNTAERSKFSIIYFVLLFCSIFIGEIIWHLWN